MSFSIPVEDYLTKYMRPEGFDMPALLNDDFIQPVRMLWNAKHYVSALKLLLSATDTLSYLALGDIDSPFKQWLTQFGDVSSIGVSVEELWELRNGLLHTGGSDSRKVKARQVERLVAYIGELPPGSPTRDAAAKWFSLWGLILVVQNATGAWLAWMNENPEHFPAFFERYDGIAADSRLFHLSLG